MKKFEAPEMELQKFGISDVITTSTVKPGGDGEWGTYTEDD